MNAAKEQCPEEKSVQNSPVDTAHRLFTEKIEQYLENIEANIFAANEKTGEDCIEPKDMLYDLKAKCLLCGNKFVSPRVRSKYLRVKHMDKDFCKHYAAINPLFYEIMVCPQCGFAYNEEIQQIPMSSLQRQEIKSRLYTVLQGQAPKDYSGVRSLDQAIETFLLALYTLEGRPVPSSKKGMLYLKIAWLYRYQGNQWKEAKYIEKTLSALIKAYKNEIFTDAQAEVNITYLIGALFFRTGQYLEAAKWLDRVIRRPKPVLPALAKQARELWVELRQEMRKE